MNTDTIDKLLFNEVLRRLRYWEQNANPGQERKVFNAYISKLNEDVATARKFVEGLLKGQEVSKPKGGQRDDH